MKLVVTGATGFIGGALVSRLLAEGHELSALSRSGHPTAAGDRVPVMRWDPATPAPPEAFAGADAVVHLAGEPVSGRWTEGKRRAILDSRVTGTRNVVLGLAAAEPRPRHLVCASAIGYYGDRGEELLDEDSGAGEVFLSDVCVQWEEAAASARTLGLAVAQPRFGLVFGRGGGALPPLLRAARLGAAGPLGSGRQWWSWIHLEDAVGALAQLLATTHDGPLNLVAPDPVRQRDLATALGRALHRPAFAPAPSFVLRIVLGGFATELLSSRRVSAGRLVETGFAHRFGTLDEALAELCA